MAYIGKSIESGTFSVLDTSGNTYNGSNTAFNLGTQVGSVAQLLVSHDGVIQKPGTDYTLSSGGAAITFTTAPASGASIFITEISGAVGGPLDSDLNGTELILDADGDTTITADTDDQIDIKIAGADDFQFTANTFTAASGSTIAGQAVTATTIVGSGAAQFATLGIGAAKDLGTGIHVRTADSGGSVQNYADELVLEGGAAGTGMTILAQNDQSVSIMFGDQDDNDIGFIQYSHGSDYMRFVSNTTEALRLTGQKLSTRGEASPDVDGGGITLNQAADDARIFSLKNSDVAHGMTSEAETDTYGNFGKAIAAQGGLRINGYTEGTRGVKICGRAVAGNVFDGEATDTPCIVEIDGRQNDAGGTPANLIAVGADNNVFGVTNADDVQFIVKGDGEIFSNQSATVGTFDAYDDAQLVRANDLFHKKGVINSKFDKFVKYNKKDLMDARLLGRERDKDGNDSPTPFVNITGMQRLHNGAIWQQYEKHNQLLDAVYDLAKEAVGEKKANAILEKHEIKRLN